MQMVGQDNRAEHLRFNAMVSAMNVRAASMAGGLRIEMLNVQPLLNSERANRLYSDSIHANGNGSAYHAAVLDLVVLLLGVLAEREVAPPQHRSALWRRQPHSGRRLQPCSAN